MLQELAQLVAGTDEQVRLAARNKGHGKKENTVREGWELQEEDTVEEMHRKEGVEKCSEK